jgi:hypothetical protein
VCNGTIEFSSSDLKRLFSAVCDRYFHYACKIDIEGAKQRFEFKTKAGDMMSLLREGPTAERYAQIRPDSPKTSLRIYSLIGAAPLLDLVRFLLLILRAPEHNSYFLPWWQVARDARCRIQRNA